MTTLTQASIGSRKIIRYSIYLIIFLIIGRIVLIAGIGIYKKVFPPAPTPATVSFGRLSKLPFPEKQKFKLNFNPDPQKITESIYKFYHKFAPAVLETDIITGAFSISYDLKIDPTPLSVRPNQPEVSASTIRSFLSNAGLLPSDLTGQIEY